MIIVVFILSLTTISSSDIKVLEPIYLTPRSQLSSDINKIPNSLNKNQIISLNSGSINDLIILNKKNMDGNLISNSNNQNIENQVISLNSRSVINSLVMLNKRNIFEDLIYNQEQDKINEILSSDDKDEFSSSKKSRSKRDTPKEEEDDGEEEEETESNEQNIIEEMIFDSDNETENEKIRYKPWCQPSFCGSENYESDEGPGMSYCCPQDPDIEDGYEECTNPFIKSTAHTLWGEKTDYCEDSNTLMEAYIDCNAGADAIHYESINCNDYDRFIYGDGIYYCEDDKVKNGNLYVEYFCTNGKCGIKDSYWVNKTISKKGDADYCSKRKEGVENGWAGCSLCNHGDYDCDWDSECSGDLKCDGPLGDGSPDKYDGCCKSGERWDANKKECCECSTEDGICCDGCHYKSSSNICDSHYGSYYYYCDEGQSLGDDVFKEDRKRYCSGSSSSCDGEIEWNGPIVYDYCSASSDEFCDSDNQGWDAFSCSVAQCTDGVCCDTTPGVYGFFTTNHLCFEELEYGCPFGTTAGTDVYKRNVKQYCSGSSRSCTGNLVQENWAISEECSQNQGCYVNYVSEEHFCKSIVCSKDSDCPQNDWFNLKCLDGNVYGCLKEYICENPGTTESECDWTGSLCFFKEYCGEDFWEEWGDPYCKDGNVYHNRTYHDRGCSNAKCYDNTNIEEGIVQDCGSWGCLNGKCLFEYTCSKDSDCGTDDWIGTPICENNDIYQDWRTWICENPGTQNAKCIATYTNKLKEECGEDFWEEWGELYCKDSDVYHNRTYHDRGCNNGGCINETYTEEEKVQDCGLAGCSNKKCLFEPACFEDSDCGTDGWIGTSICKDNDIYQDWRTWACENPGTTGANCTYTDTDKLKEECGLAGCSSNDTCRNSARINLKKGTNLFSLPLIPVTGQESFSSFNTNCVIVKGGKDSKCSGDNLAYWNPITNDYVCLNLNSKLYAGQGYFIKVEGDCYFDIIGDNFFNANKIGFLGNGKLYSGFNLIGALSSAIKIRDITESCSIKSWPQTYAYNTKSCNNVGGYNRNFAYCDTMSDGISYCYCEVSILEPGKGYWIETTSDCSLK